MNEGIKKHVGESIVTLLILAACFGVSVILQDVLPVSEHITTVFVFGVFLISLLTDGYLYGILSAFVAVFAVNYAFAFPYFSFNFTIPENVISALIMIVISLMTSALTTKLKRWQDIKAKSEREIMRANLLRAVSHDLRTPLTTIYGASSAILENYDSLSDEQKKRMLSGMNEDSQWLIGMVENLLSITRIERGAVELIKTPTVLDELIDSVILKLKKRYPDTDVRIDIPDDVIIIPMDAMLVEQVIVNILENAVLHAEGMTAITLRVYSNDGWAVFEISDDGCGIERDRLDRIFDGYYAGESVASDMHKRNLGIGLSVCAAIVNAHGGTIEAENARDGGAVFRFKLEVEEGSYE